MELIQNTYLIGAAVVFVVILISSLGSGLGEAEFMEAAVAAATWPIWFLLLVVGGIVVFLSRTQGGE